MWPFSLTALILLMPCFTLIVYVSDDLPLLNIIVSNSQLMAQMIINVHCPDVNIDVSKLDGCRDMIKMLK